MGPLGSTPGGQLLALLGAAAPSGEDELPGSRPLPSFIDPQAWLMAAASSAFLSTSVGIPSQAGHRLGLGGSRPRLEEAKLGRFLESSAPAVIADGLIPEPEARARPSPDKGEGPEGREEQGEERRERKGMWFSRSHRTS